MSDASFEHCEVCGQPEYACECSEAALARFELAKAKLKAALRQWDKRAEDLGLINLSELP